MTTVNFSVELINAILQYLSNRPYSEVAGLIEAVRNQAANQQPSGVVAAPAVETD